MQLPNIKAAEVAGKTVFLRADVDVPLSEGREIEDDTRLKAWFPTLEYLLNKRAKVIIGGHLGRPHKKCDMWDTGCHLQVEIDKFGLEPVAKWLSKVSSIKYQVSSIGGFTGWKFADNLFLLENLRFNKEESEYPDSTQGEEFSKKLASLADIYVNDCFATSHRNHASVVGVAKLLPHFAGFRLQEEIKVLSEILKAPKRPFTVVVGGAKLETKLPLLSKMHGVADYLLVGGKLVEDKETLIKLQSIESKAIVLIADFAEGGEDITEYSLDNFLEIIERSKTVIWNGPMGKIQNSGVRVHNSSTKLAEGILKSKAYSVVGGGDTLGFLSEMGLLNKFSFYSTGGGAMLSFLSGEKLPGLEVLMN